VPPVDPRATLTSVRYVAVQSTTGVVAWSIAGCGGSASHAGTLNPAPLSFLVASDAALASLETRPLLPGLLPVCFGDLLHHVIKIEGARFLARREFAKAL
jgi:hypothetical protein